MTRDVFNMAFACGVEGRAKAASPILPLSKKLDDFFRVRAGLASVALFVVLVKGVGAPKAAVATRFRAWVFPPTLVKLIFVTFPVVLALEASLA